MNANPEGDVIDRVAVWDELVGSWVDSGITISSSKVDWYWSAAGDVDVGQGDVAGRESPEGNHNTPVDVVSGLAISAS